MQKTSQSKLLEAELRLIIANINKVKFRTQTTLHLSKTCQSFALKKEN